MINSQKERRTFTPLALVFLILGIGLFVYYIQRAGLAEIAAGIRNLGVGFLLVIGISAVRQIVRSLAWVLCMEDTRQLRFRDAFRARVMGDAIGNILPFASFVISEPAKPALIRDRVPLIAGVSAIAIENIFYALSVIVFIFSGMLALLLSFSLTKGIRLAAIITIAVVVLFMLSAVFLIWKQFRFVSAIARLLQRAGLGGKWVGSAGDFEDRIYGFYRRNRARFLPILLLEACFHLAGVGEIYVTLHFISPQHPPTLFSAFILESVNRVITMAFKFVPLRMGFDEAGTGKISKLLLFTEATGVTLAIVRKARDLFWALIGMALLIQHSLSWRRASSDANSAMNREPAISSAKQSP